MNTEKLPEWAKELARETCLYCAGAGAGKVRREPEDWGPGIELICPQCLRTASVLVETRERALEEAASKLDKSAEHHAEQDRHAAWDSTRVDAELCEEHGHVYHSYPGYAAHVVGQMANVIRSLKGTP